MTIIGISIATFRGFNSNKTPEDNVDFSGINKICEMAKDPQCPFVLYVGRKKLIKRVAFEKYINNTLEL